MAPPENNPRGRCLSQSDRCIVPAPARFRGLARLLIICALVFGSSGGGGCAAIPLAAVGEVIGAAGSAASGGAAVFSLGKLDFSVNADLDQCYTATREAIADLHLTIKVSKFADGQRDLVVWKLEDNRKSKITIRLDRRTARLCACRVDVGLFGSEPTAKLVMARIRHHLPNDAGVKDQQWWGCAKPRCSGATPLRRSTGTTTTHLPVFDVFAAGGDNGVS